MEQALYELPEGWEWRLVGEVGGFIRGVTYKKGDLVASKTPETVTLLRANNIQSNLDLSEVQLLPHHIVKAEKLLQKDDILFCMSSGSKHLVGKNVLITKDLGNYSFGAFCSVLRFTGGVYSAYFAQYFSSPQYKEALLPLSRGTGINNLKGKDLELLSIPLPPLNEQKRIIARLDALFTRIDAAITHLQQTLELTKALFASTLDQSISNRQIKITKPFIELAKFIDYRGKTPKKTTCGVSLVTAKNVRMGYINEEPREYIAEEDYEPWMTRGFPHVGDILFTTEAPLGNVALITRTDKFALAQRVICLQSLGSEYISPYLVHYMQSYEFVSMLEKGKTGSTVKGIKSSVLKKFDIPLPSIEEQHKIVSHLDALSERTRALEVATQEKLNDLTAFKASLLDAAFKGQLVTSPQAAKNVD